MFHYLTDYKCQLQGIITCPVIPSVILEKDMKYKGKDTMKEYSVKHYDVFDDRVYNLKLTQDLKALRLLKLLIKGPACIGTYYGDDRYVEDNTSLCIILLSLLVILYHLCQDKQDDTTNDKTDTNNCEIVVTKGIHQCIEYLKQSKMLIIKGRRGTGKSKIARYIACRNEDHKLVIMTRNDSKDTASRMFESLQNTNDNIIVIFDEMFDAFANTEDINQALMITEKILQLPRVKSILTVDETDMTLADTLRRRNDDVKMEMVDLDYEFPMSKDEKRALIDRHLQNYVSRPTKHGNLDIQDSEKEVENIINTDTFLGFPFMCASFFGNTDSFKLGSKYFRQPHKSLLDEIEQLRVGCSGKKDEYYRDQYCVLVYILLNKEGVINVNAVNMELYRNLRKRSEIIKDFTESCVPRDKPEYLRDMLCSVVDEFGNNVLTYCVLWWNENSRNLTSFLSERFACDMKFWRSNREVLFTENEDKTSALHFAVYFGRRKTIQTFMELKLLTVKENLFFQKAENKSFFNRIDKLIELGKQGESRLYSQSMRYNIDICNKVDYGSRSDYTEIQQLLKEIKATMKSELDS
ncbi:unnamed protein product [Mytilus edulis]|uniref:Novel STAND NTPase 3 domain-containing protein n=1 Tax=Mytilus edulis TaxID=6550 RepID=A0A8S3UIX3_MYTED|nr:unnamed protein product [Mytilus edulis]